MFKGIRNGLLGVRASTGEPENTNNQDDNNVSESDEQPETTGNAKCKKSKSKFSTMIGKLHKQSSTKKQQESNSFNHMLDETDILSEQMQNGCKVAEDDTESKDSSPYIDKAAFILPEEQCDIPTFLHTKNCDPSLIKETRRLLDERYAKNPDAFYDHDYKRMCSDDWTVSRFLLRRRLDPKRTAKLMEECGRFRKQYKMSEMQLWEFPIEFHKAGGLFMYAPDRVGNLTLYMRVKMYRRVPEISDVFKAFILCVLEQCDVANGGRGTAVVFDLTGCGLQNVDLSFLSWLLSSFRNYCPKGVSYILVYNLPWILNATCKLAMTWMSSSNRRALRFVYGDEIENFIARENLPDYLGGTCMINYKVVPEGSKPATEVCGRLDMTREQALKIRDLFKEYISDDDDDDHSNNRGIDSEHELAEHDQDNRYPSSDYKLDAEQIHAGAKTPGLVRKKSQAQKEDLHKSASTPANLVSQASKFVA